MGEKLRILILEDVPSDAELATHEFRKAGMSFAAKRVETRKAFLHELEHFAPDVILCDYMLPQFDGMTALRIARERLPHVPVIMFTGSINEETAVECIKAGAADYVLKTHLTRLGSAVEGAVERFRERANRQLAEEAVRDSEQRLKILFECAPDAIYLHDLTGTFVDGNLAAERLTGYKREELIGKSFLTSGLLVPDQVLKAASLLAKSVLGKATGPDELVLRRKDGGNVTVEISARPVRIHDRRLVLAVARDVTERKQAEADLRKSEKRFRDILESVADGIVMVDDRREIVLVNEQAEHLFGYTRQELIGEPIDMLVPGHFGDHSKHVESYLAKPSSRPMAQSQELYGQRKDGTQVAIEVSLSPLETDDGLLVTAVVHDVTERREADEALRRSERQYRDLVEHAIYGIYRSTADGKFLSVNRALVEMLGYESRADLLAKHAADLYQDPTERDSLVEHYRTAERQKGLGVNWKRKDGTPITVILNARRVVDAQEELQGFEVIVEDVTQHRILEAQLRQAQKMEAVGQLTGGIAHDFNNLLSVILLNTQSAASALESKAPEALEELQDVERAAKRAAGMTKQLLGFSRSTDINPEPHDLAELIRNLRSMLRPVIPESIELHVQADDSVNTVMVDAGAVEQCVINLVTNARDAMPNGGKLTIDVRNAELDQAYLHLHPWVKPGAYVCVSVSDTGIGMDETTKARLFEPFFTTKGPDSGTGLGMAMVYGLTKQQQGYVHVYSEVGEGTTMRLYYRVTGERARPSMVSPTVEPETGGTETILLVEDEEMLRRTGKRVLERYGYTVITAADGAEALEVWRAHRAEIDLVLSDMVMPRMSGAELYGHLEKEPDTPKFILASGYPDRDVRDRKGLDSSVPLVRKPWEIDVLLARVREELGR